MHLCKSKHHLRESVEEKDVLWGNNTVRGLVNDLESDLSEEGSTDLSGRAVELPRTAHSF